MNLASTVAHMDTSAEVLKQVMEMKNEEVQC
jgi:hypothetical protein